MIAFDEGEAGIGALGAVEFEIPAEVTAPIRAQNSPLGCGVTREAKEK